MLDIFINIPVGFFSRDGELNTSYHRQKKVERGTSGIFFENIVDS